MELDRPNMTHKYSPQRDARLAGWLYVFIIVGGYYAEAIVRSSVVVAGNAAVTAHNILASDLFYRSGAATQLAVLLCDTTVAVLLFNVLRPVSHTGALLAALFRIVFVAILAAGAIFYFAPLFLLGGSAKFASLSPAEAQSLAVLSLRLYTKAFQIGLVFFGASIFLVGALIIRSTFLPRSLGLILLLAGVAYVMFSFLNFLTPNVAQNFGTYLLLLGFLAELSLTLWLIVFGVNPDKWQMLLPTDH